MAAVSPNPDWIGMLYKVDKRLGRTDTITFVSFLNEAKPRKHHFSHEQTDGMGALVKLMHQSRVSSFKAPSRRDARLKLSSMSRGVQKFARDLKPTQTMFKKETQRSASAPAPKPQENEAYFILDKHSSQLLFDRLKSEKLNVTATLLHFCHEFIRDHFMISGNAPQKWLLPLNMRTSFEHSCVQNRSTGIGIDLSGSESLEETTQRYFASLNPIAAKLTYWASKIGCVVGEEVLFRLAKLRGSKNNWIGTFSSLGRFDFSSQDSQERLAIPEALVFWPPAGSPCFPIGFGLVNWNGCLSLGLRVHPSLDPSVVNSHVIVQKILSRLSFYCEKELTCRNFLDLP